MTARVNGEVWSRGNSRSIHWKFEQMIEFLSQGDTIYAGDVIGSGTVGTGCGLELDRWVPRGDVMECCATAWCRIGLCTRAHRRWSV